MHHRFPGKSGGFTLLELLAAVTLLVVLGALLFEVFSQASEVIRMGNGRLEVFQYARALFRTLERELAGAIGDQDAAPSVVGSPFKVHTTAQALQSSGLDVRPGTDAVSLTSALVGRDTVKDSPTYGQTANSAYVAFWVSPKNFALNRYESYDLKEPTSGRGWEFASNVLEFRIRCLAQSSNPVTFKSMDWDSNEQVDGVRRGLPGAVMVTAKLTDRAHVGLYRFDTSTKTSKLREGLDEEDDHVAQEFCGIVHIR